MPPMRPFISFRREFEAPVYLEAQATHVVFDTPQTGVDLVGYIAGCEILGHGMPAGKTQGSEGRSNRLMRKPCPGTCTARTTKGRAQIV